RWLEEKILELGPESVGAFIGEPIQGAGGLIVPPQSYWSEVQRICREYDILLIADEVICGFGRTGNWWGSETFGISPDFMTLAKGLSSGYMPISAIMVGDRVADALIDWDDELAHGFTYSGHPVACAVALKNIEIFERENLVGRVADDIGPYFQDSVRNLLDHRLVGEVRGYGLIAGIELTPNKQTRAQFEKEGKLGGAVRDACTDLGIVCRAVRDVMMLSPPLIIEREEVDILVNTLRRAIDTAADRLGV
ncbi:MAG: aminotransferase class III-fold pyridoxal phosphate-dependent enzyme, partial [Pseudomonadota bacterium]